MNQYVKVFLQRGIAFGGFGPIVTGLVLACIQWSGVDVLLTGSDVLIAVLSTYVLAFVQAGSSVFNQVENWSIAKGMGIHFLSLYIVYVSCYLVNRWIPLKWEIVLLFTLVFVAIYLAVWLTVYLIVRKTSRKLNQNIQN